MPRTSPTLSPPAVKTFPPQCPSDFKIAIICALPLEASAVCALFDERWNNTAYDRAETDSNAYSTGRIGQHDVVVIHMPGMGKVDAATAAADLSASFPGIQLALVVGICGGAPEGLQRGQEILLGDVVISDGLVQYDLGRQFPNHKFLRKDTPSDNLPRPSRKIRSTLAKLQTEHGRRQLQGTTLSSLQALQQRLGDAVAYPGAEEDRSFKSTYRHKHHKPGVCALCDNHDGKRNICNHAIFLSCEELGCDKQELLPRSRSSRPFQPDVHFGRIASGDTVMKSGEDRDAIIGRDQVVAFEMEGAGVWEKFSNCLVVKGVCDYADSHKSKKWQGYAAATAAAVTAGILEDWGIGPSRQPSPHRELGRPETSPALGAKEIEMLKRLDKSPYRDRKERNPDRIEGTCEWFVTHESFNNWRESKISTMLWVSADPGCGKSVLAKYLVDEVLTTTQLRTTCYFFFKDDFEDQRSVTSAICCILHQLFVQKPILLSDEILKRFEVGQENFANSFFELWEILIGAAQDTNAGEIICILDAFDECDDHGRSLLSKELCKLYSTKGKFNLKFLLTSRPYGRIRQGFQGLEAPDLPVIHLSGESEDEVKKISQEIDIYIKARVLNIGSRLRLREDEKNVLLQQLMCVQNRTYLWVYLILDLIECDININKIGIIKATSRIPTTVDEAYDRILCKSRDVGEARKILHIIVAAARPLSLKEMAFALAIQKSHRSYDDLDLTPEDRFREGIRDICGLLVTVIDSRIYLLHQTVKEFLVPNQKTAYPRSASSDLQWKHSIQLHDAHHILAEICSWYLSFAEFETHPLDTDAMLCPYTENHAFLDYSAKHWHTHVRESCILLDKAAVELILGLCDTISKRCFTWFRVYWKSTNTEFPSDFSTLMIVSYFGLAPAVAYLLELNGKNLNLNYKDEVNGRSALSWAAGNGFDATVELLVGNVNNPLKKFRLFLRMGVEVDSRDRYQRTPLVYAVWGEHKAIIKVLLKAGANINLKDEIGGTPLSYAVCSGRDEIFKLLFKGKKARVGPEEGTSRHLLLSAIEKGHDAVVKLLLDTGRVDLNFGDKHGSTPLHLAARRGNGAAVKLLLEKGADPDSRDFDGETPLRQAAMHGNEAVVRLLLENGVDPSSQYEKFISPLHLAAMHGNEAVVRLLLENGVDPDSWDPYGETPLHWAAQSGNEAVVKLLLEKDVDLNSRDLLDQTPLHWAAMEGDWAVIRVLLENGADAGLRDNFGITPLQHAAGEAAARLLQERSRGKQT